MRRSWVFAVFAGTLIAAALVSPSVASAHGGGWVIQTSPNPAGSSDSQLDAVSCVSGGCQAVGYASTSTGLDTLAEGESGSSWTIEPSLSVSKDSYLSGLSCAGASWCMAVGQSISASAAERSLAEIWNGSTWSLVPTPKAGGPKGSSGLVAVSCTSADWCLAVGGYTKAGVNAQDQPLAELWNGTRWSMLSVPNPRAENGSELEGVSCTSGGPCTAVGIYDFADIDQSVFAMHYADGTWTTQKQPNPGDEGFDTDSGVSCFSAAECVSVGSFTNIGGATQVLAEGWSGSTWQRQRAQGPSGAVFSAFDGVSCPSSTQCTAVGDWSANEDDNPQLTLASRWNGTQWTAQATPSPAGAVSSMLASVSCPTTTSCTAVGDSRNGAQTDTLVEVYSSS